MNLLKTAQLRSTLSILGFSLFSLAIGLALFYRAGLFEVRTVGIELKDSPIQKQATTLGPSGLRTRLEGMVRPLSGKKIWNINLHQLEASVAGDEWVKTVLISRRLPNQIDLEVVAKAPTYSILSSRNLLVPVLEDGTMLSALPVDANPDGPVVRGDNFLRDKDLRIKLANLITELPADGVSSRKNISEMSWSAEEGITMFLIEPRVQINLGFDRLSIKVQRVAHVLDYLQSNQLKGRVIDASFSKKVLVRLRKDP